MINNHNMTPETKQEIINAFLARNCIVDQTTITNYSDKISYKCVCGKEREELFKDFMREKSCRECEKIKSKEIPPNDILCEDEDGNYIELFKPVVGGWISDAGHAKNYLGKDLTLCKTKFRFHIGGKHQYASNLVAITFKLPNYEKLFDKTSGYIVTHVNRNKSDNSVTNLQIIHKSQRFFENKPRQSETFQDKIWWTRERFSDIEQRIIPELPNHIIYKNGEIWNGKNFLTFSKTENYLNICLKEKTYKVHRLICYAFQPIDGKKMLTDYEGLKINHKDGNTTNNLADNLEWVSHSENMLHAYATGLNKKVRGILQYDLEFNFIKEFISIADASRQTSESEHNISSSAKGKQSSTAMFIWKYKNEAETAEYSKKYSKF